MKNYKRNHLILIGIEDFMKSYKNAVPIDIQRSEEQLLIELSESAIESPNNIISLYIESDKTVNNKEISFDFDVSKDEDSSEILVRYLNP